MARSMTKNPSTLVTVLVSSVSALIGGAVVHQLWRSGKIGGEATPECGEGTYYNSTTGKCEPYVITGLVPGVTLNPRRRRRRRRWMW